MYIYEIRNTITNKCYIGQTTRSVRTRWCEHRYALNKNRHGNRYLQYSWNKYGEKVFEVKVIYQCDSIEELNQKEIELISAGYAQYNLAPGGNSHKHDDETREVIAECGKKPIVGMNVSTGEIKRYPSVMDAQELGVNPKSVGGACQLRIYQGKTRHVQRLSCNGWVWMYEDQYTIEELERRRKAALRSKVRLERPIAGIDIFFNKIVLFASAEEARRAGLNVSSRILSDNMRTGSGRLWTYADIDGYESLLKDSLALYRKRILGDLQ